MLEAILLAAGYKVGLYTSPHLIDFNERARVNGQIATDEALIEQFQAVEAARGDTSLTYFEFTTLAILRLFSQSRLDAVVLEVAWAAGWTRSISSTRTVRSSPAWTWTTWTGWATRARRSASRRRISTGRASPPSAAIRRRRSRCWTMPPPSAPTCGCSAAISITRAIASNGPTAGANSRSALAIPLRGANQLLNASAALAALESVRELLPVPQQAVRMGLLQASLPGRFQILPGQPAVILDVAHNPHAAAVLAQNRTTWVSIRIPTRSSAC